MSENDINKYINKTNRNKYINIKFVYISNFEIPDFIEVLYFK